MVSRMISGGSAGLMMMMALPFRAADAFDRAGGGAVNLVDVLARAGAGGFGRHGGDDLAVRHLLHARHGGQTIGMVAWPRPVTILTFISPAHVFRAG